ncbi:MAG: response regulator transcription factor [Anaerolineaceae bacterium]|nr:response regulator transcription factor [Anaerolineaceae bacterium]
MSEIIRIAIADDHDMLRKGISAFLDTNPDFELVGEATTGIEAIELCMASQPDIVLMDLYMPEMDGVAAIKAIKKAFPNIQIIALSSFSERDLIQSALEAGANGYLLKNVSAGKLAESIRIAHSGIATMSPEITPILFQKDKALNDFDLTKRELEVLSLLVEGFANAEIAYRLNISKFTVKNHVSHILMKLGVNGRTEAVRVALKNNLV